MARWCERRVRSRSADRAVGRFLGAICLAAPLSVACGPTAVEPSSVEPTPFRLERGWPIVRAEAGGVTRRFLVDTGAQGSVLDRRAFSKVSSVQSSVDGKAHVDIRALGRSFAAQAVVLLDFEQVGCFGIDGIIGADILSRFVLTIDYQGERIWLRDRPDDVPLGLDARRIAEPIATPLEPGDKGWLSTTVRIENASSNMLIDTGASVIVVEPSLLDAIGHVDRPEATVSVDNGLLRGGVAARVVARVHDVTLQGSVLHDVAVTALSEDSSTSPPAFEGLLGTPFFRYFLTTIDGPGKKLTLAAYRDPSHVDPSEYVRLGFDVESYGAEWRVSQLFEGSSAAQSLVVGDVVDAIGDVALTADLDRSSADDLVHGRPLGESVPVTVVRMGASQTVDIEVENILPRFAP